MTDTAAEPVVLINVYTCKPEQLDTLMDLLAVMVRTQREAEGFISATLHRGLNGKGAAVHAVWRSAADWKAMLFWRVNGNSRFSQSTEYLSATFLINILYGLRKYTCLDRTVGDDHNHQSSDTIERLEQHYDSGAE